MMKSCLFLALGLLLTPGANAATPELARYYDAALGNSRNLLTAGDDEKIAAFRVSLAQTGYLPNLQATAIDTTGFPGSTGALGVAGLVGSPYRKGWGYGLVLTQNIFDFGQTGRSVARARQDEAVAKSAVKIQEIDVKRAVLEAFLDCSLVETERENWGAVHDFSTIVQKEVARYVNTGQRSVVDNALVQAQVDEAARKIRRFDVEAGAVKQRLSVLTGFAPERISCPKVAELNDAAVLVGAPDENLYVKNAELRVKAAEARATEARGGYLPKLVGLASVGDVQNARLVPEKNYALGIGLTVPIFDSNRTRTQVKIADAQTEKSQHELAAVAQQTDLQNAKLSEEVLSLNTEVASLREEFRRADLAFRQAKKRYFGLSGNLADLRESIRNYTRLQAELSVGLSQSYRLRALQLLLNGRGGKVAE